MSAARADAMAVWAAAAGCFVLYLLSAAPATYWLDSSELAAAAFGLGVPHPPGHPLWAMLAKAATLIPIGSVAFRINILSALGGAASCALTTAIALRLVRARHPSARLAPALCAAGGLLLGASSAFWLQSVRAEVYTPHAAAMLLAVWLAVRHALADETGDAETWRGPAPLAAAALVLGLSLASHHYLVLLTLPAFVYLLLSTPSGRALVASRRVLLLVVPGLAGLLTYAYLPVRAAQDPAVCWGAPTTLSRLWDVISARTFQASVTETGDNDIVANLGSELLLMMSQLHPMVVVLGIGGLGVLSLRWAPRWGTFFGLLLLGNLMSTALMRFDPQNPDAHGYLELSHALVVILAAVLVSRFADGAARSRVLSAILGAALVLAAAAGILRQLTELGPRSDLRAFDAPELVEDATLAVAPPGSLVLASYYSMLFQHWYAQQVDGRRPDITVVQQSFDAKMNDGVPYTEAMRRHNPRWSAVFDAFLRDRTFPQQEVLAAAVTEPVLVEPELAMPLPTARLRGLGLLFRVIPAGESTTPRQDVAVRWGRLDRALRGHGSRADETRAALLWAHFRAATVYLRQQELDAAGDETNRAIALNNTSPGVRRLAQLVAHMMAAPPEQRRHMAAQLEGGDLGALVAP